MYKYETPEESPDDQYYPALDDTYIKNDWDIHDWVFPIDENVKVAKIAKVREKLSDGVTEYDDVDSAEQHMEEEKAAMPVHEPVEDPDDDDDLIYPTEDEE